VALEAAYQQQVGQVRLPHVRSVVDDERHLLLDDGALERLERARLVGAPAADAAREVGPLGVDDGEDSLDVLLIAHRVEVHDEALPRRRQEVAESRPELQVKSLAAHVDEVAGGTSAGAKPLCEH